MVRLLGTFLCAALIVTPAVATTLNGEVSVDRQSQTAPPELNREAPSADRAVKTSRRDGDEFKFIPLGECHTYPGDVVLKVDPACDIAHKLVPGDRVLAIDGLPARDWHLRRRNFGDAGDVVQITFSHDGAVQTLPCKGQLLALGIGAYNSNGLNTVDTVDPACDIVDKLVPGDMILAIDGVTPDERFERHLSLRGKSFDDIGEVTQITFSHYDTVQTLPCKRQPIRNFSLKIIMEGPPPFNPLHPELPQLPNLNEDFRLSKFKQYSQ
jgi:hypothetical protein